MIAIPVAPSTSLIVFASWMFIVVSAFCIRHLHAPAPIHQNIFRLDVAMHDALIVRELQRIANLRHDGQPITDCPRRKPEPNYRAGALQ